MKRIGNIYAQIYHFENLYKAAIKARKGNRCSASSQHFFFHLEKEILQLQVELKTETYQPGTYHYFQIYDPKERIISVAPFRDRVVHHSLVGLLEPIYEKRFIHHSYACRKGKGTHQAIEVAQKMLRKNHWFFKTDIDHFFDSVVHNKLLEIIERKIKDKAVLNLIAKILNNANQQGKSLPIGNLTSQFFANVYLNELDFFIKNELKCQPYLRYMDDFVLFSNDKAILKIWKKSIEKWLELKLELKLKAAATIINQQLNGLSFLGRRIFPRVIRIKRDCLKRSLKKLKQREFEYAYGLIDEEKLTQSALSIIGNWTKSDTLQLRQKIFKAYSNEKQ